MTSVKVILCNPRDTQQQLEYVIRPFATRTAAHWIRALQELLVSDSQLNQDYCFLGFPHTHRDLDYLCGQLNAAVQRINTHVWPDLPAYVIEDWFSADAVRFGMEYPVPPNPHADMLPYALKHQIMNRLHNHFERLQGTVEDPSPYFQAAPPHIRQAMGQLNTLCHEIENLVLSQRKARFMPEWVRPSQIMNWDAAPRYNITEDHQACCWMNGFDRKFGHVYMHWAQIGKTLMEVFRDEGAPDLDAATCEAITHLRYYTGEFDIEWGQDVVSGRAPWHDTELRAFHEWLQHNGFDRNDPDLMLGYAPLGEIDCQSAFGTRDPQQVWQQLGQHLTVHRIECGTIGRTYHV